MVAGVSSLRSFIPSSEEPIVEGSGLNPLSRISAGYHKKYGCKENKVNRIVSSPGSKSVGIQTRLRLT